MGNWVLCIAMVPIKLQTTHSAYSVPEDYSICHVATIISRASIAYENIDDYHRIACDRFSQGIFNLARLKNSATHRLLLIIFK